MNSLDKYSCFYYGRERKLRKEGKDLRETYMRMALALTAGEDPEKVWVIGGGEIYRALLPHCRRCCLTRVYARPDCDVFFPDLDQLENWCLFRSEPICTEGELDFQFVDYQNAALPE